MRQKALGAEGGGIRTTPQVPRRARVSGSQSQGRSLGLGDAPSWAFNLPGFHFLAQPVSDPLIWTLVGGGPRSHSIGVRFLAFTSSHLRGTMLPSVHPLPGLLFSPDPGDGGHGAETLLLLPGAALFLTETWAGECRLEGGTASAGVGRTGRTPGKEREPAALAQTCPLPHVPSCPSCFPPSSLPQSWSSSRASPSPGSRLLLGPSPRTRTPNREEVGPGPPLPAPRLPLPEIFLHRRQPGNLGEPRFIAVGYVDDTQFVRFDSDTRIRGWSRGRGGWSRRGPVLDRLPRRTRTPPHRFPTNLNNLRGYYN